MDLKALRNYDEWRKQSPFLVRYYVVRANGWRNVWATPEFKGKPPLWASRVRNYFNETPRKLTRLDAKTGAPHLKKAQKAIPAAERAEAKAFYDRLAPGFWEKRQERTLRGLYEKPAPPDPKARLGIVDTIATRMALSGDVYADDSGRIWFQMDPGGAIYHYGEKPWAPGVEAFWASGVGQELIPVFKLVSPDDTGGSRECIIKNPFEQPLQVRNNIGTPIDVFLRYAGPKIGRINIGEVNQEVDVFKLCRVITADKNPVHQGSYNYAETIDQGLPAHNRFDVDTDLMLPTFFADPPDPFSELQVRRFPEKKNGESIPLADQINYR